MEPLSFRLFTVHFTCNLFQCLLFIDFRKENEALRDYINSSNSQRYKMIDLEFKLSFVSVKRTSPFHHLKQLHVYHPQKTSLSFLNGGDFYLHGTFSIQDIFHCHNCGMLLAYDAWKHYILEPTEHSHNKGQHRPKYQWC